MFVFWTAVVVVGISIRVVAFCNKERSKWTEIVREEELDNGYNIVDERMKLSRRPSVWLRRYITTPATFGYKCAQNVGWCTIPPRIQSLTILVFILMNIIFCIHGYWVFPGNM
jgi:hypothetical protein